MGLEHLASVEHKTTGVGLEKQPGIDLEAVAECEDQEMQRWAVMEGAGLVQDHAMAVVKEPEVEQERASSVLSVPTLGCEDSERRSAMPALSLAQEQYH